MPGQRPEDRREIEDCLPRYVRGVDRRDGNDPLEHARRELGPH
jgi:hypothetical protein